MSLKDYWRKALASDKSKVDGGFNQASFRAQIKAEMPGLEHKDMRFILKLLRTAWLDGVEQAKGNK